MLRSRVLLTVLALLALPFVASAAQGRGKEKASTQSAEQSWVCTPDQAAHVARLRAEGLPIPPGLDRKNCAATPPAPVPPPVVPPPVVPPPVVPPPAELPPGIHTVAGVVYEDLPDMNGVPNGQFDMFGGEFGLSGWTVQLFDANGLLVATRTTGVNGNYAFQGLANGTYSVCAVVQAGYVRTEPASGDACGGAGWAVPFTGSLAQEFPAFFGMTMP